MVESIRAYFSMPGMSVKILLLIIFFLVMTAIGIYSRKKINSLGDFVLGGRKMGPWLSAFAYGTAYFSAVIFIGYAGSIGWKFGLPAVWIGIGNALIGSLLSWLVLGERTRAMTRQLDTRTMPEYFEKRYDSKALRIVASIIIFIFLVPYSASVYTGLGYLFERVFHIDYIYCMVGMAVLTGLYLVLGGYIATAINDFIQGIIMLAGVILMIGYVLGAPEVGGLAGGVSKLNDIDPALTSLFGSNPRDLFGLVTLTSLGVWGLPQMIHKFYTIKDKQSIKRGTIISTVFALVIGAGAYFTGAFAKLFLNNTVPEINGQPSFDAMMPQMLEKALPAVLMGVIIILVLSASMSTLAALVLTSSSTITLDFISGFVFKKMNKKYEMILVRVFCVIFVTASVLIALSKGAIVTLMSISWGAVSGAFLAPFLYGLFWKGVNRAGVWAGFITGLGITISSILFPSLGLSAPNAGALAMFASLVVVPLVSLATANIKTFSVDREKVDFAFEPLEKEEETRESPVVASSIQ